MSPIEPFRSVRHATAEISVWGGGMAIPRVDDVVERDGRQVRVLKVLTRRPRPDPYSRTGFELEASPNYGDFMLILEYEELSVT